jgi:hypothetical protein
MQYKTIIILYLLFLTIFSCKRIDLDRIAKVQTNEFIIKEGYITLIGTIVDVPENGLIDYGHCISLTANPTLKDLVFSNGESKEQKEFVTSIANLLADKTYYYAAYAITNSDTLYGEIKSFNTNDYNSIAITTTNPTITGNSNLSVDGSITGLGSLNAIDYGHCWNTASNPTINNYKNNLGTLNSDINYVSDIANVPLDIKYYIKSYVKLSDQTILYGNEQSIVIPDLHLTTDTFNLPVPNTATLQGTIISTGINPIIDHGHCYSTTTSNPNINNQKLSLGSINTAGTFFTTLPSITNGTTYYYRSYAISGNSVKYGKVKKIVK